MREVNPERAVVRGLQPRDRARRFGGEFLESLDDRVVEGVAAFGRPGLRLSLQRPDESWAVIWTASSGGAYRSPGLIRKVHVIPSADTSGMEAARSGRRTAPPSAVGRPS